MRSTFPSTSQSREARPRLTPRESILSTASCMLVTGHRIVGREGSYVITSGFGRDLAQNPTFCCIFRFFSKLPTESKLFFYIQAEDEDEELEKAEDEDFDVSEKSGSDEDGGDDSDDYSDEDSEENFSEESDDSGASEAASEESGKDWDELENEAKRADNERGEYSEFFKNFHVFQKNS